MAGAGPATPEPSSCGGGRAFDAESIAISHRRIGAFAVGPPSTMSLVAGVARAVEVAARIVAGDMVASRPEWESGIRFTKPCSERA